ncbi:MFS transporter [Aliikangiella sp. IMCC44359]|uniref:MFS transporter n=1 Tax=Aliikangiella sp. IMCC44359 TaxID=3459125 RepID=UPI00403A8391
MLKNYFSFARSNSHFLLFGLLTAFFGNYGQTFFISWYSQSFQSEFQLSAVEYGLLYSVATLLSGFIILFAGALLDKTPLKKFTFITSLGLTFACFMIYFSQAIWQLFAALFFLRFCGQGLMFHIAYTSMARYFDKNRGKAIGIVGFGMPLGEAILPILAITLINLLGWRESWFILGVVIIVIYWPFMNYLMNQSLERIQSIKPQASEKTDTNRKSWKRKQVIKDPRFWLLIPLVMAPAFIVTGIFIHQAELLKDKNWSEEWFALCFTVYAFSHLKSSLVVGSLVDQYSGKRLVQFFILPMLIGVAILMLPINHQAITVLFMFLVGITIGSSSPIVGSLWVEIYGPLHIGAIRSLVTSIMVVSTAISPALMGWLFDNHHSYQQIMLYLFIYQVIAWLLLKFFVLSKIE